MKTLKAATAALGFALGISFAAPALAARPLATDGPAAQAAGKSLHGVQALHKGKSVRPPHAAPLYLADAKKDMKGQGEKVRAERRAKRKAAEKAAKKDRKNAGKKAKPDIDKLLKHGINKPKIDAQKNMHGNGEKIRAERRAERKAAEKAAEKNKPLTRKEKLMRKQLEKAKSEKTTNVK